MGWLHKVKVKHLFTENEDHESIQTSMMAVADTIDKEQCFWAFDTSKFRAIPEGDDFFGPVDYANKLLDSMYDYADHQRIWIE